MEDRTWRIRIIWMVPGGETPNIDDYASQVFANGSRELLLELQGRIQYDMELNAKDNKQSITTRLETAYDTIVYRTETIHQIIVYLGKNK